MHTSLPAEWPIAGWVPFNPLENTGLSWRTGEHGGGIEQDGEDGKDYPQITQMDADFFGENPPGIMYFCERFYALPVGKPN